MTATRRLIGSLVDKLESRRPGRPPKILVLGDVMLDEYIFGSVERISPEAPIPVVECEDRVSRLGGAANVAANLAAFGADASLVGVVGKDPAGEEICRLLASAGLSAAHLLHSAGRATTRKLRVVASGQQVVRVDFEQRDGVDETLLDQLCDQIEGQVGNCDAVVISDYGKGVCSRGAVVAAIEAARRFELPVLCDPKGPDYSKYAGATTITPNRKEAGEAVLAALASRKELDQAARQLRDRLRVSGCLITLGSDGMLLCDEAGTLHIEAFAREVADVTGAGDTVIAMLAFATSCGLSFCDAGLMANAAAAIAVGKIGSSTVTLQEIREEYAPGAPIGSLSRKILDLPTLVEMAQLSRSKGGTIVFTNGCFDLLHAGHVENLTRAAEFGDLLVVGLNSDASVRRLKGPGRPVVAERDRALVLSAMACVDYVVIFEEDTPEALISAISPDILVKGADYAGTKVVGEEVVVANGGRLELLPLKPGHSTSSLISSIIQGA